MCSIEGLEFYCGENKECNGADHSDSQCNVDEESCLQCSDTVICYKESEVDETTGDASTAEVPPPTDTDGQTTDLPPDTTTDTTPDTTTDTSSSDPAATGDASTIIVP